VVDLLRNGWTIYAGTTGRNPPERVDDLARNRWSESPEYPATILSDMDAEITALETRRDKTRALKQGMMQELLTGRFRLV